jgi:hypothetical protein
MLEFLDDLFTFLVLGGVSLALFVVGTLMALGGLTIGGGVLWTAWLALTSQRWAETTGEVVRSRAKGGDELDIAYRYAVEGRHLIGDRLAFAMPMTPAADRRALRATLRAYQKGAPVTVFFDARRPTRATLDRRLPRGAVRSCLTAAALILVGFILGGGGGCGLAELLFGATNC